MEQKFDFQGNLVRVKVDQSEQYWFVTTDVCRILNVDNVSEAIKHLDEDDKKLDNISGETQKIWMINDFGMFYLIYHSKEPLAKEFKRWVNYELFPGIQKARKIN